MRSEILHVRMFGRILLARRAELRARCIELAQQVVVVGRAPVALRLEPGDLARQARDVGMIVRVQRARARELGLERAQPVGGRQDALAGIGEHDRIRLELRELRFEVDLLLRERALLGRRVAQLLLGAIEQLHVELHQLGQLA